MDQQKRFQWRSLFARRALVPQDAPPTMLGAALFLCICRRKKKSADASINRPIANLKEGIFSHFFAQFLSRSTVQEMAGNKENQRQVDFFGHWLCWLFGIVACVRCKNKKKQKKEEQKNTAALSVSLKKKETGARRREHRSEWVNESVYFFFKKKEEECGKRISNNHQWTVIGWPPRSDSCGWPCGVECCRMWRPRESMRHSDAYTGVSGSRHLCDPGTRQRHTAPSRRPPSEAQRRTDRAWVRAVAGAPGSGRHTSHVCT